MTGLHHMLVHFPEAFWALATLMVLVGALLSGRLAELSRAALLPVLALSLLGAIAAIVSGFLVWSLEATLHSPLARNHLLMALWSLGVYALLAVLVWRAGPAAFDGARRWALVILALVGALLFAATGTLGGHLAGAPTAFSELLRLTGWEVYTTFYAPTWAVAVMLLIALGAAVLGYRRRHRAGSGG
ncbi:heme ABC transporter permease [Billgrantia azerbaijanica]|nr:heme ABC transporter permease [Halomonas azerbaijanica]